MKRTYPAEMTSRQGGGSDDSVDMLELALLLAARKRFIFLLAFALQC